MRHLSIGAEAARALRSRSMDDKTVIKAYKRYAKNYDRIFGKVFEHGRRVLIDKMAFASGQRILEVGVGTGLSLPLYPDDVDRKSVV